MVFPHWRNMEFVYSICVRDLNRTWTGEVLRHLASILEMSSALHISFMGI